MPVLRTALREPSFVLFVAGAFLLSGNNLWSVSLLQVLISTATIWLVYELAAILFGAWCARFAVWC